MNPPPRGCDPVVSTVDWDFDASDDPRTPMIVGTAIDHSACHANSFSETGRGAVHRFRQRWEEAEVPCLPLIRVLMYGEKCP